MTCHRPSREPLGVAIGRALDAADAEPADILEAVLVAIEAREPLALAAEQSTGAWGALAQFWQPTATNEGKESPCKDSTGSNCSGR